MPPDSDIDLSDIRPEVDVAGTRPRNPCAIEQTLEAIPDGQQDTFLSLVLDPSLQASRLARKLRDRGIYISDQTIRRHQKRDCARCHFHDRY